MGWLVDLIKPMVARVWQAFRGFGHTMDAHVCTNHDQVLEQIAAFGEQVIAPYRANVVGGAAANPRGERRGD